jgi:translocation and assembly module TamB
VSRLRRYALYALALGLLSLSGLIAVLYSTTFAGWLIPRVVPAGVQVGAIRGSLAGGLEMDALRAPGVAVDRFSAAAAIWPSLLGTPTLARLDAAGIRVDPAAFPASDPADAPTEAMRWPSGMPRFAVGALNLRDIEIAAASAEPLRIERAGWRQLHSHGDALYIEALEVEGPELSAKLTGRLGWSSASDLRAEWRYGGVVLRLTVGGSPAAGVDVDLQTLAPLAGRVHGRLLGLPTAPSAELRVELPTLGAAPAGLEALRNLVPLGADLRLRGELAALQLDGALTLQGQPLRLDGSRIGHDDGRILLMPLQLGLGEGQLQVEGDWPLRDAAAAGSLRLRGERLAWHGVPVELARLVAEVNGRADALNFEVDAGVQHAEMALPTRLAGRLADGVLEVDPLSLTTGDGELSGQLRYALASGALEAEFGLRAVNLAVVLPEHPTRLDGALAIRGGSDGWRLEVQALSGDWRTLPLTLDGVIDWSGSSLPVGRLEGEIDGNVLRLRPIADGHEASLRLGRLAGLLPGAEAAGRIELRQTGQTLSWVLDLERLNWNRDTLRLESRGVRSEGRHELGVTQRVQALLELRELRYGDAAYGPVTLSVEGSEAAHRVALEARTPQLELALEAEGALQRPAAGPTWSGALSRLVLSPSALPAPGFALAEAQLLAVSADTLRLGRGCLRRDAAELCLAAEVALGGTAPGRIELDLTALDLAMLPPPAEAAWSLAGALAGRVAVVLAGGAPQSLDASLAGEALSITITEEERSKTLTLDTLQFAARGPIRDLGVNLEAELRDAGSLQLSARGIGAAALEAALDVDFASLAVLDGLSPELATPQGQLAGRLTLSGAPEQLQFGGALQLSDFAAEIPAAGLKLVDGRFSLSLPEPGKLLVQGRVGTGQGQLAVDATAHLDAEGQAQLEATLSGERVLVADLPNVRLLASPDLQLATRAGVLRVTGKLGLPEGRIDLERFEPAVSVSPDVVVLDRPSAAPAPVQTDVRYTLGPALKLKGFGLDAGLQGGVRVRSRPGRPITATGTVDLTGGYRAYGQNLTIDRGRLLWTNAPIGNPGFDFSAFRTIEQLKAGVRVRGSATAPELTVYTDPPREASDALSWLVLGRPLSSASGDDGQQLSAAAGALGSVGGALIGATIGQRLGVEINVESSAELGGSPAFTVGKMLSPKLFVGFGRSLFDSAQLVIVRYRLTEHYELEALSGRESKLGANYRIER